MISCYVSYFQRHLTDSEFSHFSRSLEELVGIAQRKERLNYSQVAFQIRTNKGTGLLCLKKRNRCLVIYYLRPFLTEMAEVVLQTPYHSAIEAGATQICTPKIYQLERPFNTQNKRSPSLDEQAEEKNDNVPFNRYLFSLIMYKHHLAAHCFLLARLP